MVTRSIDLPDDIHLSGPRFSAQHLSRSAHVTDLVPQPAEQALGSGRVRKDGDRVCQVHSSSTLQPPPHRGPEPRRLTWHSVGQHQPQRVRGGRARLSDFVRPGHKRPLRSVAHQGPSAAPAALRASPIASTESADRACRESSRAWPTLHWRPLLQYSAVALASILKSGDEARLELAKAADGLYQT